MKREGEGAERHGARAYMLWRGAGDEGKGDPGSVQGGRTGGHLGMLPCRWAALLLRSWSSDGKGDNFACIVARRERDDVRRRPLIVIVELRGLKRLVTWLVCPRA